jgi:site-specific recombinase XerD
MKGEPLQGCKHWLSQWSKKQASEISHSLASRLVMKGVDLRTVQEFMGQHNIPMTCRYAHPAPEHKQAAVERLCEVTVTTRKTPELIPFAASL